MNTSKLYLYISLVGGGVVLGTLITALGIAAFVPKDSALDTSSQKSGDEIQITDILSPGESNRKSFSGTIKSVSGTEQIMVTSEAQVDIPVNITSSTDIIQRQRKTDQQFEEDIQAYNNGELDRPPSLYDNTELNVDQLQVDDAVNIQTINNIVGATEVEARRVSVDIPTEEQEDTEESE